MTGEIVSVELEVYTKSNLSHTCASDVAGGRHVQRVRPYCLEVSSLGVFRSDSTRFPEDFSF